MGPLTNITGSLDIYSYVAQVSKYVPDIAMGMQSTIGKIADCSKCVAWGTASNIMTILAVIEAEEGAEKLFDQNQRTFTLSVFVQAAKAAALTMGAIACETGFIVRPADAIAVSIWAGKYLFDGVLHAANGEYRKALKDGTKVAAFAAMSFALATSEKVMTYAIIAGAFGAAAKASIVVVKHYEVYRANKALTQTGQQ